MTDYLKINEERWNTLPGGGWRFNVKKLLDNPDWLLKLKYGYFKNFWNRERGWEYEKYSRWFSGCDVLEIGGGLGHDGIVYSQTANTYTYAELNETQVQFLKKITSLHGVHNARFELMENIHHEFTGKYSAFYAHGVLHHVPFETAREEFANVNKYLLPGSKVVMLMYPKARWEKAGRPSFEKFGLFTDGGCPWAEWYDEKKIMQLIGSEYQLTDTIYWGNDKAEFVNFELVKH